MSEAKFTPGPWERVRNGIHQDGGDRRRIASVVFPVGTKEKAADGAESDRAFADAALIAAAPDLYAYAECADAVRMYLNGLMGVKQVEFRLSAHGRADDGPGYGEFLDALLAAALAKVKGGVA